MNRPTRIVVVDDHALVREGLVRLLEQVPSVEAVGQAATWDEAVALARELQPDVALIDLRLPDVDGIAVTRSMLEVCSNLRVLILSDGESEDALLQAIRAGASGFLLRTQPFDSVRRAIDVAMDGGIALPRRLTARALANVGSSPNGEPFLPSALTRRERQILVWIAEGETNRQIGERLVISEHTVRAHLRNLMRRLGVSNRAQAAALAATYTGLSTRESE
jgi:DNA-binding NarL/FixJ family response regulator